MTHTATLAEALLASVLAGGVATTIGGAPVTFVSSLRRSVELTALGFGAGVMLAASAFSLLLPAVTQVSAQEEGVVLGLALIVAGFLGGGALVSLADKYIPHEHFTPGHEDRDSSRFSRMWLFVIAITIHNFPEGLAVGVAFGAGEVSDSMALAIGIGAQNIPEGLVVAIAMVSVGYSRLHALAVTALSGFVEPVGALFGYLGAQVASAALPFMLALAAGAMVFVVSDEIIPESHREKGEGKATLGLMIGFVLMMVLDVVLA